MQLKLGKASELLKYKRCLCVYLSTIKALVPATFFPGTNIDPALEYTHTHTDTDTQTQTHRHTQTHTDTHRHTHTHTHTHRVSLVYIPCGSFTDSFLRF
jgi:ABC-type Zn2+ transport system substrate-binding protein/surface adhesin